MTEEVLDASAIDGLNDFDLTGESEDLDSTEVDNSDENASQDDPNNSENQENEDPSEGGEEPNENSEEDEDDFTLSVLRLKGIQDPSKIKFENEFGDIEERNWNDLTDAERLNILASEGDPERDLEDDEIEFINVLRSNKLTPQQYIQAIQQQAAQDALAKYQQSQTPTYEIDSLSDDELFALDLLEKVGEENITDEELQEALQQAKSNESLFAKQIEGLRATYKNLEDQQKYDAEQAQIQQAEQQYQEFSNKVLNAITGFNTFANQDIELSTDDKNDIANYLLTRRDTGISDFYKDIQDPATATLAAFWLLRGPEVLSEMENQVKAAYQAGYSRGQRASQPEASTPKAPQVVIQQKTTPNPVNSALQSAFGLEDDSYLH